MKKEPILTPDFFILMKKVIMAFNAPVGTSFKKNALWCREIMISHRHPDSKFYFFQVIYNMAYEDEHRMYENK